MCCYCCVLLLVVLLLVVLLVVVAQKVDVLESPDSVRGCPLKRTHFSYLSTCLLS